jgi:hypothetical protein
MFMPKQYTQQNEYDVHEENQTLRDAFHEASRYLPGQGFRGFRRALFAKPQSRLILLMVLVAIRMWDWTYVEFPMNQMYPLDRSSYDPTSIVNLIFGLIFAVLFMRWAGREFDRSGVGAVLVKTILIFAVVSIAFAWLFDSWSSNDWFRGNAWVMLQGKMVPGHASPPANFLGGISALVAGSILLVSNAGNRFIGLLLRSQAPIFKAIRSCFEEFSHD